jgi:DNA polymerase (family 10)
MTNKEIARAVRELGDLMELHQENSFKIRSYQNAYLLLRKLDQPLAEIPEAELRAMKGIGEAIASKIHELLGSGQMATLEKYRVMTPPGVREMLEIKGFGPKKIWTIWKDLGIETVGELLYACNENRLVELKGFGLKTQAEVAKMAEYFLRSKDKFLFASIEAYAQNLLAEIRRRMPLLRIELAGELRRCANVVSGIELVADDRLDLPHVFDGELLKPATPPSASPLKGSTGGSDIPVTVHLVGAQEFGSKLFRFSGAKAFLEAFVQAFPAIDFSNLPDEQDIFTKVDIEPIAPELREDGQWIAAARTRSLPRLLEHEDVRGVVHSHSTYSDGIHTLRELAEAAMQAGYEYLVITDHSQSAFYANGLKVERLRQQWQEVEALNSELAPFRVFRGIESDILSDGSLDYPDEILGQFEVVIASVHSNLRMDEAKATARLLRAVENPHTTLLGHPTGRLLLAREGYPLDHRRIIDACAAHGVGIELNANPYRLDLDWSWIPYAASCGVPISINPDAHSREGIFDIRYGVLSARKGGLTAKNCWNELPLEAFAERLNTKKRSPG